MKLTREQIKDYMNCMNDIKYFAEKYIKINTRKDIGVETIQLNDFQKQVIKDYNEKKQFSKTASRMQGKTTVAAIILLHQALFSEYRVSGIFSNNFVNGTNILEVIFNMYEFLPDHIKYFSRITKRNKTKLEFDNMCSIVNFGSNPDNAKGIGLSNIYIDEYDFVVSFKDILAKLYPVIVTSGKIFALKGQAKDCIPE